MNAPATHAAESPRSQFRPFQRVAFRGESPETALDYVGSDPNLGYPMGYFGRLGGVVTQDQPALRAAYRAIVAEAHA